MMMPCALIGPDGARQIFLLPRAFTTVDGVQHPSAAWEAWSDHDWDTLLPGWRRVPIIDEEPPPDPTKAIERLPESEWTVGDDAVRVTYRITTKSADLIAAEQEAALKEWENRSADVVQRHLDVTVGERGYSSVVAAVSYCGDPNAAWDAEGCAVLAWRSAVWSKFYAVTADVRVGKRLAPSEQELLAELPPLVWPA